jgi:hypothetical protein
MNSGTVPSEYWMGLLRDHQLKLMSNSPRGGKRRYAVTIKEIMAVYEREETKREDVPIVMVGSKVDEGNLPPTTIPKFPQAPSLSLWRRSSHYIIAV